MTNEKKRFKDQVVAITGAARGIGKNIARAFGREGAVVILLDIDTEKGIATKDEFQREGLSVEFMEVDLRRDDEPRRIIRQIVGQWKRIDILVNNARPRNRVNIYDETEETWKQSMDVILKAAFFASQAAIESMSKTGGGCIVNMSSAAAFFVCHESPAYHTTKAELLQMTRYLAAEAGKFNVRVNAVVPGFIVQDEDRERYDSEQNKRYRKVAEFVHPISRVGTSDNVADAVLFLCSNEASFITGQGLVVDGGLSIQEQSRLVFRFAEENKLI